MTRNVRGRSWWFECDTWPASPECTRLGPFPTQRAIPLAPMAGLGWFVARMWGDCCPACVRRQGGMAAVLAVADTLPRGADGSPHPGAPNSVMDTIRVGAQ